MKVKELIRALSTCHEDAEVFFDEAAVNSVYEVAVRKNENQPWKVKSLGCKLLDRFSLALKSLSHSHSFHTSMEITSGSDFQSPSRQRTRKMFILTMVHHTSSRLPTRRESR